jgi:fructokinase
VGEAVRIGVDLGGTKIEVIALGPAGEVLARWRCDSPRNDYQATLDAVRGCVARVESEVEARGSVGIGTPGALSRVTGMLKNSNSTWLNGKPIVADLERVLDRPVRIANDADCFALSEAIDGAAAGAAVVFGVIVGTGTGAGVVVHGRPLSGPNGIAGEWGHNPLPWPEEFEIPGPSCWCGKRGCIETYLSGPGMAADHERATGGRMSAQDIVARSATGDDVCRETLDRYIDRMARSLSHVINILDPDVIVLGGGMSNIDVLYEAVPKRWGRFVFSDAVATRLVRNVHGDSSGVRGAAWLWSAGTGDS